MLCESLCAAAIVILSASSKTSILVAQSGCGSHGRRMASQGSSIYDTPTSGGDLESNCGSDNHVQRGTFVLVMAERKQHKTVCLTARPCFLFRLKQETMTVIYPQMQEEFTPRYLNLLMAHLDSCKDVCDYFGISTALVPFTDEKKKIVGFTVKSYRNPGADSKDEFDFAYDPFWDDGTDFDALYKGIDDEYGDAPKDPYPEIVNKVPDDDDQIIDITKKWVNKLMSDMGICPFTSGAEMAGLPIGNVFYGVDRCSGFEDMYHGYWKEVVRLERNPEKDISTTLLITPEFCLDNIELFDSFTTTLTQPLAALGIEDLLQLVFFHPNWSFRDGSARSGEQEAANYARRSPWPMINLLRTSQVRAAQKGIPTGLVYKQNEKTLQSIGVDRLEKMMRLRDWSDIADLKVNRREMDALKIAQDFQQTGAIRQEDTSIELDATPAANKVRRSQVDQGNLVNVLMQALEKRLGKTEEGKPSPLSGPETSATAMATDVLMGELEHVAGALTETAEVISKDDDVTTEAVTDNDEKEYSETDELKKAKQARMEKARQAIFDDLRSAENPSKDRGPLGRGDEMGDVLFGKGGIASALADEDEIFPEGMNPDSFF
jgi:hypothetical protein